MANQFSEDFDNTGRRISFGIFVVIVGFFAVAFRFVPIPNRDAVDRSLDILMLESYLMETTTEDEEDDGAEIPVEVQTEVEDQIGDVDELLAAFGDLSLSQVTSEGVSLSDVSSGEQLEFQPDLDIGLDFSSSDLGGFGNSRPSDLNADLLPQSSREGDRWTLKPNLVSGLTPDNQPEFQTRNNAGISDSDDLIVRETQPDDFFDEIIEERGPSDGINLADLEREDAVVAWFKANEGPLDPGIRALFNEQLSGSYTANLSAEIGGQMVPIQLMYSHPSKKLHIAFSEEENLFYYIDPALRNVANYYKEGVVVYDEAARIVIVESEELSVDSPNAVRVYKKFVSWWIGQVGPAR